MPTPTDFKDTLPVSLSGNAFVDSLLFDRKWDLSASNIITYSFPTIDSVWASQFYMPGSLDQLGYEPFDPGYNLITSDTLQNQIFDAITTWQNVANITFLEVADNATSAGDIRFAFTNMESNVQAHAYIPSQTPRGGDIWFNTLGTSFTDPDWERGTHEYFTVIHELGHALGLDHPFESEFSGVPLPPELDYIWHSVMAYNDHLNGTVFTEFKPTTPMHLDIDAVHYLYGANMSFNAGNNLYVFQQSKKYLETIWDAGGIDTIQYNATSIGGEIDLRPGEWSQLGAGIELYNFNGTLNRIEKDSINIFKSVLPTGHEVIIENAIGSDFNDLIIGNKVANNLVGNSGNDTLDGADYKDLAQGTPDIDTLTGGLGDDEYFVDHLNDQVIELANQGKDTINAYITYSIENQLNIENLTLVGNLSTEARGNIHNNYIKGNNADNSALAGLTGIDTLEGGLGDDTYLVDLFLSTSDPNTAKFQLEDLIIEGTNGGTDTIKLYGNLDGSALHNTYTTITLTGGAYANFENIDLTETNFSKINITGNAADNILIGNDEANTMDGAAGVDTMGGGKGDDTYVLSALNEVIVEELDQGNDLANVNISVVNGSYTLAENLERATITSTIAFGLIGNSLNNTLTGNAASNILDGGFGSDTMAGGAGNDFYFVDNTDDVTTEAANAGTDTVNSSITHTLAANIENLILLGSANINGTGNNLSNIIQGNAGNNIISGGAGTEADTVSYENASGGVVVNLTTQTATGFGNDTLQNIEAAVGSNFNDNLRGSSGANFLEGLAGNDTIDGDGGVDSLRGGQGNDTFIIDILATGALQDTYTELVNEGNDTVQLRGNSTNTTALTLTIAAHVENMNATATNLSLLNITGNTLDNIITGNNAANILSGLAGADTMFGGLGNDTYIVDSLGDVVTETTSNVNGGGLDLVQSAVTFTLGDHLDNLTLTGTAVINGTGNILNNTLIGNSAINILDGGIGLDNMAGGAGDDTYFIDNSGDIVTELANAGIDTINSSIAYSLIDTDGTGADGGNVENLFLLGTENINGTGNNLDNLIQGNLGNNLITGNAGNDVIRGGGGTDTMIGGTGDDVYVIDSLDDVVTETLADTVTGGVDTIQSTITYNLTGKQHIERLTLLGVALINATGNELSNLLTGNAVSNFLIDNVGDDTLDGGVGDDTLQGGIGNDTYIVDSVDDVVIETEADSVVGGIDTIESSVSFTLSESQFVENIRLTRLNVINATGNSLANIMTGNVAANILNGGLGNDTLVGSAGRDTMNGGDGIDTASFINATSNVTVNLSLTSTQVANDGQGSTDMLTSIENIIGSTRNDSITGDINNNQLDGEAGNDNINGGDGNDTLIGGAGNDTLTGGLGLDFVSYVTSTSAINVNLLLNSANDGFSGIDTLNDIEHVIGSNFNDIIQGDGSNNHITGNNGNDSLNGVAGNDTLAGGAGNDTLDGGLGIDTAVFSQSTGAYSFAYTGANNQLIVTGADGIDTLRDMEQLQFANKLLTIPNGLNYIASNPDLIQFFGANPDSGVNHFLNIGHTEGRVLSFAALDYIAINPDLIQFFGANESAAIMHYITQGFFENRSTNFDALDYIASNPDLIPFFGANESAATMHFITQGFFENRSTNFNALDYIASNPDLIPFFGANETAAIMHYITQGFFENRSTNFNALDYIASNPDLIQFFGANESTATLHYINQGFFENRNFNFDSQFYLAKHTDLRDVFGTNNSQATMHFITNGFFEGRVATNIGNDTLVGSNLADTLNGGLGTDLMTGGLGADTFDFNNITESVVGANRDVITDFSVAQGDKIDLATIDANSTVANDQAFLAAILSSGDFNAIGQLRLVGNVLSGNTDTNFLTSEFEIQLTGVTSITSAAFIL